MLGRKNYSQEEMDHGRAAVDKQLAAYRTLVAAASSGPSSGSSGDVDAAREAFETVLFNNMVLVLDRYFVHRVRPVTGKDLNPLNEVELLAESLMNNDGILRAGTVIKFTPDRSVLKLNIGDPIRLTADQFERLSTAFFAELEARFL